MEVRDQHRVDAPERAGVDLGRAAQVRDAVPEQRVGEQPDAVEVDEDGRVADVLDPAAGRRRAHVAILRRDARGRPERGVGSARVAGCPSRLGAPPQGARALSVNVTVRTMPRGRGHRRPRLGVRLHPRSDHDALPGAVLRARARARRASDAAAPSDRAGRVRDDARARARSRSASSSSCSCSRRSSRASGTSSTPCRAWSTTSRPARRSAPGSTSTARRPRRAQANAKEIAQGIASARRRRHRRPRLGLQPRARPRHGDLPDAVPDDRPAAPDRSRRHPARPARLRPLEPHVGADHHGRLEDDARQHRDLDHLRHDLRRLGLAARHAVPGRDGRDRRAARPDPDGRRHDRRGDPRARDADRRA